MREKYEKEIRLANLQGRDPEMKLKSERRGRPLLLGPIDMLVQNYLRAVRARGCVVSFTIAESVAIALIRKHPEHNLDHIKVTGSSFAQSILRRMKLVRRFGTTGKVQISEDLRQELSKSFCMVS
ncbi:uncharacterized protein LOC130641912 isoform X2 [Hydractinia symbiolongicarpus]|uniref:uncharacterized protein LOC130641912 isoform X2 n=1 Tax=Hydractinia symbiolongicarpus TaxID=13093 RepID=UPI00254BA7F3|nr:uncharacterized protein LOC130641912 isoform X2 [Hydractinia symbiolongicarpus]